MRILSRHFLANYLGLFSLTLIIALILMTVIEMLVNLDDVVENRESAGGALAYLLIRVPSLYMRDVIPAASAIAAFLCLALAARAREITALKTGGIPPLRVALPVLMAAMALSGVALVLNETLLLGATREFTRLQHPEESVVFRRGSFWYHRENTFYNVREIDPAAGTMQGIHVYTLSPE
ncbi:MAG: LptF/LptG family permease, partial [Myxococcota bacterium]|nr:LptF/LptG family permease [Myxococcota bacterium]